MRDYLKGNENPSPSLVIHPKTTDYPRLGGQVSDVSKCITPPAGEAAAFSEMFDSYKEANKTPVLLQAKFDIPYKYQLVDNSTTNAFFEAKGSDGWKTFYEHYPNSDGLMEMSAVGFNED